MPKESGFGGYIGFGVGAMGIKSNTIAGTSFGEITDSTIDSLGESTKFEYQVNASPNAEVHYTFGETRTQIILGNKLEDYIRFDMTSVLALRQEVGEFGNIEGAFIFSAMAPTVWRDPFLTGAERRATERNTLGGRLTWERIMQSPFAFSYSYRDQDIDREESGVSLGLSAADRALLDRNGDSHTLELKAQFPVARGQFLTPSFRFVNYNLDGDAVKNNLYEFQLTHMMMTRKWVFISNALAGLGDYDTDNPVFDKTRDDRRYGLTFSAFYKGLFDVEKLSATMSVGGLREDASINFYDTDIWILNMGVLYRF